MKFAITLQGYSSKSYKFVREIFDKSLPTIQTIRNYLNKLDVKPGFSEASMYMLKEKSNSFQEKDTHLFVSLSVDDISIREHIQVVGTKVHGYVDLGDGPGERKATDAMVILCTTLNSDIKLPIGFFLIDKKLSGLDRAELMKKAIELVNNTGAVITNIACDNPKVNLSMLKQLGAVLDPDNLNPKLSIKLFYDFYYTVYGKPQK